MSLHSAEIWGVEGISYWHLRVRCTICSSSGHHFSRALTMQSLGCAPEQAMPTRCMHRGMQKACCLQQSSSPTAWAHLGKAVVAGRIVRPLEGVPVKEQHVQEHAAAPGVRLLAIVGPLGVADHLGGCVVGSAHLGVAQRVLVTLGVPEVCQLEDALALVQQRILQLDVPGGTAL